MRLLIIAALLAFSPALGLAADDTVRLEQVAGTIEITIGGEKFATYHYEGFEKPFMEDLRGPGGVIVTRSLKKEAVTDHPHHKGLWASVDEVNENKHWMEGQPIRVESVEILKAEGDPASFRISNTWLGNDEKPVLKEDTTVHVFADRVVSYDMKLSPAGDEPVTFGDTKEGFFAIRVRDELREKGGTGKIVNSNGAKGESEAWGQTSPWVDYSGSVEGKPVGVAIFDHPSNFRPSRYHVRAYGLFAVSPFGESSYTNGKNDARPFTLEKGDTLRLRYAAFIHAGNAGSADVAGRYAAYAKAK
ncbi:MAG: PmoA family protein [Planctomycetaceae bacterium]|nr:PmoA family protein [Planctomycetaceae bacterium]